MDSRELTDLVNKGFNVEMNGLKFIACGKLFPEILQKMMDYETYRANIRPPSDADDFIHSITSGTNVIRTTAVTPELHFILLMSQLACCCELLNGWVIKGSTLSLSSFPDYIAKRLQLALKTTPDSVYDYMKRLNNADTVRTIQMLSLLGLLDIKSQNCTQLSLGAGFGRKDIYAVHATPCIYNNSCADTQSDDLALQFSINPREPAQITLVDNDKSLVDLYKNYNLESNGAIHAIIDNATNALNKLPELLDKNVIKPFNLIIGIRVDHRMIDDVADFFDKLARVMEPQADLVISVGAGYSASEFEGRVNLISSIFEHLRNKEHNPTRMILHSGKTLKESRETPAFGYAAIATHEVLYCRLHRENLH